MVRLSIFEGNAHTMDRIAMLHTVGSAIAPLVYELDEDIGLQNFLEAFKPVWKALDSDHNLCDSFVSHFCS